MNILVIRSINRGVSTFIEEQVQSLREKGISTDYYNILGTGKLGYLKNIFPLKKKLSRKDYTFVHAHGGLAGLLANLQRRVPVITTYHGTDVNKKSNIKYSMLAASLSHFKVLTNKKLNDVLKLTKGYSVIPCGIDFENFKPMSRDFCKQQMGLSLTKDYILFSSSYGRDEKNAELAQKAVYELKNTELIELKGYSREEVVLLINASRLVLMTSHYESAPLIVKEALACNIPVVSTDVGDVKDVLQDVSGSYLVDYSTEDVIRKCRAILYSDNVFTSRENIKKYDLSAIASRIKELYLQLEAKQ